MRAGRLRHYVELYQMQADPPAPVLVDKVWMSIEPPARDVDMSRRGLRASQSTSVIARYWDQIRADRYITWRGHLYHIDGVASRDQNNEYLQLSCTELVAPIGTYTPVNGAPFNVRAFVVRGSDLTGQFALANQRNAIVEVPQFELQTAWDYGDSLDLQGVTWDLHSTTDGGDDGVVVRLQANAREL